MRPWPGDLSSLHSADMLMWAEDPQGPPPVAGRPPALKGRRAGKAAAPVWRQEDVSSEEGRNQCSFYECGRPRIFGIGVHNGEVLLVYFPLMSMKCSPQSLLLTFG